MKEAQEDVVRIGAGPTLTDDRMRCMAGVSLATNYDIYFDEGRNWKTYNPIYLALERLAERREARDWLRRRGKLSALPRFDRKQTVASFARQLELYCGVQPGSTLMAFSPHLITVSDPMKIMAAGARFTCLMRAISASNLAQDGIAFGFLGNAAVDSER